MSAIFRPAVAEFGRANDRGDRFTASRAGQRGVNESPDRGIGQATAVHETTPEAAGTRSSFHDANSCE